MTEPTPPKYIYKILPSCPPPPTPLPMSLPLSDLDSRDGFIHMSTSVQILGTLKAFFNNAASIVILRVPYERVESRVKWEMAKGKRPEERGGCWDTEGILGGFPHIYHAPDGELRLGREEVQDSGTWNRVGETWSQEGWPFGSDDLPKES
ncbi:hypothetical protein BJ875DRAFT_59122 [Amylocarpus encephaloides]|uniref:DUF952 domain-containing protein n=1 Tax=Amylocarpus encephaloides TaxID=45428 RepID=A0A9P8C4C5_9HELO|nr:hypothetical protein BJ875DRAFT_59122 [Amylocarpus encephaloides]